ncbi:gem-associated protein 7-like [Sinocyclocheilus grahami]|uniref:Gem-associated protein 7-like n=1 Tax=Sinocyclocheilus grahami TaxID=75366 RepID=A0A672LT90_SINGR|nr:PREDICTED: gem-associated protein 7-like [Sinocyclocheilus grahami]
MKTPVSVLRLPRGPGPNSRGFDPSSPRFTALRSSSSSSSDDDDDEEQQRQRFLWTLSLMKDKLVQFDMHERVRMLDVQRFQVSDLETPLGVQREALLRSQDVLACSFEL